MAVPLPRSSPVTRPPILPPEFVPPFNVLGEEYNPPQKMVTYNWGIVRKMCYLNFHLRAKLCSSVPSSCWCGWESLFRQDQRCGCINCYSINCSNNPKSQHASHYQIPVFAFSLWCLLAEITHFPHNSWSAWVRHLAISKNGFHLKCRAAWIHA